MTNFPIALAAGFAVLLIIIVIGVRSAVALSYYRMAMAARGVVWAGDGAAGTGEVQ